MPSLTHCRRCAALRDRPASADQSAGNRYDSDAYAKRTRIFRGARRAALQ